MQNAHRLDWAYDQLHALIPARTWVDVPHHLAHAAHAPAPVLALDALEEGTQSNAKVIGASYGKASHAGKGHHHRRMSVEAFA
jgi:hypothetical protein